MLRNKLIDAGSKKQNVMQQKNSVMGTEKLYRREQINITDKNSLSEISKSSKKRCHNRQNLLLDPEETTGLGHKVRWGNGKIVLTSEKKNNLTIVNCYAPHMGTAKNDITKTQQLHKDKGIAFHKFPRRDVIVLGDINARLEKNRRAHSGRTH